MLEYQTGLIVLLKGRKDYTERIASMGRMRPQSIILQEEANVRLPLSEGFTIFTALREEYSAEAYVQKNTSHLYKEIISSYLQSPIKKEKKFRAGWRTPRFEEERDIFEYVQEVEEQERRLNAQGRRRMERIENPGTKSIYTVTALEVGGSASLAYRKANWSGEASMLSIFRLDFRP
uniref:Uncharacterized protein n=1 Tax=Parastrongyloides trichosuri TaxID=131310 RepID=A0A0N4ZXY0_PARTI